MGENCRGRFMNKKITLILTGIVLLITVAGAIYMKGYEMLGLPLGFAAGMLNDYWLLRLTKKLAEKEVVSALKIYFTNFIFRFGMLAVVFVLAALLLPKLIYTVAIGMILGVVIPLMIEKRKLLQKGSDKKDA